MNGVVPGVDLHPLLVAFSSFFQFAGGDVVVQGNDVRAFAFRDAISQFEGLLDRGDGKIDLVQVVIRSRERSIGKSEIGIQLDGTFVKWNRLRGVFFTRGAQSKAVGLQCFQRSRGRLGQR